MESKPKGFNSLHRVYYWYILLAVEAIKDNLINKKKIEDSNNVIIVAVSDQIYLFVSFTILFPPDKNISIVWVYFLLIFQEVTENVDTRTWLSRSPNSLVLWLTNCAHEPLYLCVIYWTNYEKLKQIWLGRAN